MSLWPSQPVTSVADWFSTCSPRRALLIAHKLEENGNFANPYPALSPDLAPADFILFGILRSQLAGRIFESADEMIEQICEMTSTIPQARLETVSSNGKKDCNSA
jgi:hypothetical protein